MTSTKPIGTLSGHAARLARIAFHPSGERQNPSRLALAPPRALTLNAVLYYFWQASTLPQLALTKPGACGMWKHKSRCVYKKDMPRR